MVALLAFRLLWGFWGGRYARLGQYRTSPAGVLRHFRAHPPTGAHTAPGVALVFLMLVAILIQSGSGLFATDDIFTEGPLSRFVSSDWVDRANWFHHRAWWIVIAALCTHVGAQLVYGLFLRDPIALSMFTGRKRVHLDDTPHFWTRALLTATLCVGLWILLDDYSR